MSLLWPFQPQPITRLAASCTADLGLETIIQAISPSHGRDILTGLCTDPSVIHYRQAVVDDLLHSPAFITEAERLLPQIATLDHYAATPGQTPLHEVLWRIGELETFIDCIRGLYRACENTVFHSEGLKKLRDTVRSIHQDTTFQHLVDELPALAEQARSISSITIGVNLDEQLRPVEATLLAVNRVRFRGTSASFLSRLFGNNEWEGIAQLHTMQQSGQQLYGVDLSNPMLYPLFRDLAQVLKQVSREIAQRLRHYTRLNTQFLRQLGAELPFYLGAVRLIQTMKQAGLPICKPELVPIEERRCELEGAYNINLALRHPDEIVTNDIDNSGCIFIVTGPNQGGKTTYTQALGLIQILAQAGLYVPARRAVISPVDGIYTHFPVEERPEMEVGRLGEEALRLNEIFTQATPHSLILLNESLASTSAGESFYLARDIVQVLRLLGARAVFATHLHDLAAEVESLNAQTKGISPLVSMVSVMHEETNRPTYKIIPGPPRGYSYAKVIAARYGISYEQLADLLYQRQVIE